MKYNSFVVFGLGKFGQSLADKLLESGADVMVVDKNEELIEAYSNRATAAIVADLTDPAAIKAIGISNIDCAVISMGTSLESSIMCTMVAKECGVKWVVVKSGSDRMGSILEKVGADEIIDPEAESAVRTARSLISSNFLEYFEVNEQICLIEMLPKDKWVGKTLKELNLRKNYGINVVAIRDGVVNEYVDPDVPLKKDEALLILIHKNNLKKLEKRG